MKKLIVSVACLLATSLSFAGGNKNVGEEDGILSKGFFFNLGFGMPSTTIKTLDGFALVPTSIGLSSPKTQTLGAQINLEIGNQWYFFTTSNIGVGLKASWFQFGYSGYTNVYNKNVKSSAFDLKIVKIAPMFTYAVNDDFGVDVSFEVAPSFLYLSEQEAGNIGGRNSKVGTFIYGVTMAPGIRARYTKFALGFDYSFGSLFGAGTQPDGNSDSVPVTQSVGNARLYLGMQF